MKAHYYSMDWGKHNQANSYQLFWVHKKTNNVALNFDNSLFSVYIFYDNIFDTRSI